MADFITSGRIVDLMLIVVAIEVVMLLSYRLKTGRGPGVVALFLNIGAGASLMVALKFKFIEAGWMLIAAALVAALLFHVSDLIWRWGESDRRAR